MARVFDPLGLVTPVTANLKLDLQQLCRKQLDWADPVPSELLSLWTENMHMIQDMKNVYFNRSIIPENAANPIVSLIVAVDASQHIGVAAIYGRGRVTCNWSKCGEEQPWQPARRGDICH